MVFALKSGFFVGSGALLHPARANDNIESAKRLRTRFFIGKLSVVGGAKDNPKLLVVWIRSHIVVSDGVESEVDAVVDALREGAGTPVSTCDLDQWSVEAGGSRPFGIDTPSADVGRFVGIGSRTEP